MIRAQSEFRVFRQYVQWERTPWRSVPSDPVRQRRLDAYQELSREWVNTARLSRVTAPSSFLTSWKQLYRRSMFCI